MEKFNNSIGYDQIMWKEDITGSVAYADALGRCSILEQKEEDSIKVGRKKDRAEWASGSVACKHTTEEAGILIHIYADQLDAY